MVSEHQDLQTRTSCWCQQIAMHTKQMPCHSKPRQDLKLQSVQGGRPRKPDDAEESHFEDDAMAETKQPQAACRQLNGINPVPLQGGNQQKLEHQKQSHNHGIVD